MGKGDRVQTGERAAAYRRERADSMEGNHDNKKIRLVATDIDGTLVKDSAKEVYDEMIEMIRTLTDAGIHFLVASGRQYGSIRRMFEKTERQLHYIAENGAHIVIGGENYAVTEMKRADVEEIVADMRALYPSGCHVVASTAKGCYVETRDADFLDLLFHSYRNDTILTDDILAVDEKIIKLAVYKKDSIREIGERLLIPKWAGRVRACMAGAEWVDFMDQSVDKGNALRRVQEALGISAAETMSFGDNGNDVGLMEAAEESYAVENAVPEVKAAAKHICPDYTRKGVYQVLRTLV